MQLRFLPGSHTASGCRGLPSHQSALARLSQRPTGRATGHQGLSGYGFWDVIGYGYTPILRI